MFFIIEKITKLKIACSLLNTHRQQHNNNNYSYFKIKLFELISIAFFKPFFLTSLEQMS